jgi:hypothetical protein
MTHPARRSHPASKQAPRQDQTDVWRALIIEKVFAKYDIRRAIMTELDDKWR